MRGGLPVTFTDKYRRTRERSMTDEHAGPTRRIVVGIDGSTSSTEALQWAVKQAELTESTLEALTTWEWPTTYGVALFLPTDYDPAADAERVLEGVLDPARKAHPTADIRAIVIEGHPALALVEASRGADLLVVGSRGHGEFSGMLLGSVSEHCVAAAHCPVLVFRDRDEDHHDVRADACVGSRFAGTGRHRFPPKRRP